MGPHCTTVQVGHKPSTRDFEVGHLRYSFVTELVSHEVRTNGLESDLERLVVQIGPLTVTDEPRRYVCNEHYHVDTLSASPSGHTPNTLPFTGVVPLGSYHRTNGNNKYVSITGKTRGDDDEGLDDNERESTEASRSSTSRYHRTPCPRLLFSFPTPLLPRKP